LQSEGKGGGFKEANSKDSRSETPEARVGKEEAKDPCRTTRDC